ncbi:MAG: hypothetical protein MJD61_00525 [Proteobacteria bacterium]|nr:hypothetical protein [Pseudomonadota bacterium]
MRSRVFLLLRVAVAACVSSGCLAGAQIPTDAYRPGLGTDYCAKQANGLRDLSQEQEVWAWIVSGLSIGSLAAGTLTTATLDPEDKWKKGVPVALNLAGAAMGVVATVIVHRSIRNGRAYNATAQAMAAARQSADPDRQMYYECIAVTAQNILARDEGMKQLQRIAAEAALAPTAPSPAPHPGYSPPRPPAPRNPPRAPALPGGPPAPDPQTVAPPPILPPLPTGQPDSSPPYP